MNKKLFLMLGLAMFTTLSMWAQADDDMYFVPSKSKRQKLSATVTTVSNSQQIAARPAQVVVYNTNSRDEDEYNRRNTGYAGSWQTGGGESGADSLVSRVDTVYVTSDEMYNPENDFIYSRRLLRFHSPRFGFALSSPYYWDLVYGYGVYNYLYDPFYLDFYDPFFWDYGWGYGWSWRPWNSWYGSFYYGYGWHSPYLYDYWGVGPYWHHSGYAYNRLSNSYNRGTFSANRFGSTTNSIQRTSAVAAANGTRNTFSTRNDNSFRTSAVRTSALRTDADTRSGVNVSATSANRVSNAGGTRTVFNGRTVNTTGTNDNSSRAVVAVPDDTYNRTSSVRQNTQNQQTITRTQNQSTATQRVTVPTTQQRTTVETPQAVQNQQRTVVNVPQRTPEPTYSTPNRSAANSFGGGGGGGARVSDGGGSRVSSGRR